MSTCDYMIGNLVIFVSNVPYIYVCASISNVSDVSDNPLGVWYYVLLVVGLIIAIIVAVMTFCYAKRELNKIMKRLKVQGEQRNERTNRGVGNQNSEVESSQGNNGIRESNRELVNV